MLTIKAEASAGADLRNSTLPDMLDLARRTGCMVEVRGNDTVFWADPGDNIEEMKAAFDRLYPKSRYVASWIKQVAPRTPVNRDVT